MNAGESPMGSIGLVVGATIGEAVKALGIDLDAVNGPLLAPGVGAQGAGPGGLAQVFGDARRRVLVNQSRGILRRDPSLRNCEVPSTRHPERHSTRCTDVHE